MKPQKLPEQTIGPNGPELSPAETAKAVKNEREWLRENNASSAVTGGPVEDLEGVPLPADLHQGTPQLEK